jgi:HD-GYP domain-containing protein (c-di-GMP phosphodiesterase class II)
MSLKSPKSDSDTGQGVLETDFWDRFFRPQNIMIPIAVEDNKFLGFLTLDNQELPAGGQQHLFDILGTPYKAELPGMTLLVGPVQPAMQHNYINALVRLADSIDKCDESAHSQHTASWAETLSRHIGLSSEEVEQIRLAGKLHDIGKAVVSRVLLTKNTALTEVDWTIMRRHPAYGAALLEPSHILETIRPMIRWHHERFNGGGYPDGLVGENIPLGARILAIVDAFSSMTIRRVYRAPMRLDKALEELVMNRGTQFDPDLVDHMIDIVTGESML